MKNNEIVLAVSRTTYPDGNVELHPNGMIPKICIAQNRVKYGGVCVNWAMEKTLEKAKEVLNG